MGKRFMLYVNGTSTKTIFHDLNFSPFQISVRLLTNGKNRKVHISTENSYTYE